jgi:hypothetical protein
MDFSHSLKGSPVGINVEVEIGEVVGGVLGSIGYVSMTG